MTHSPEEDTIPTENDGVLAQLRAEGMLGPFVVADWSANSDIGLVRSGNEDRWGHVDTALFVIADGVGGNAGGEVAAATAVGSALASGVGMTETLGQDLVARANSAVLHAGDIHGFPKLGTTLVVLGMHENHVVVVSVGDSRAYRLRAGELQQLTRDHTVSNELLASGVSLDAARGSRIRLDALTSFIGLRSDFAVPAHITSHSVVAGDRFLLTTDGVHSYVDYETIARSVGLPSCAEAVDSLLTHAREAGGRDNATAVVIDLQQASSE